MAVAFVTVCPKSFVLTPTDTITTLFYISSMMIINCSPSLFTTNKGLAIGLFVVCALSINVAVAVAVVKVCASLWLTGVVFV